MFSGKQWEVAAVYVAFAIPLAPFVRRRYASVLPVWIGFAMALLGGAIASAHMFADLLPSLSTFFNDFGTGITVYAAGFAIMAAFTQSPPQEPVSIHGHPDYRLDTISRTLARMERRINTLRVLVVASLCVTLLAMGIMLFVRV